MPEQMTAPTPSAGVLDMRVDAVESAAVVTQIVEWAAQSRPGEPGRYVCAANVHMAMEAHDHPDFAGVVNGADLVVPDGVPMVWALRALGLQQRRRVRVAPDLLYALFAACEERDLPVGLYGGSPETLRVFTSWLAQTHPALRVGCAIDPPFRPLTNDEDARFTRLIAESGARLLFVGIGCPKQERWMAAHRDDLTCAMIGVGAAFDMLGGRTKDAPTWMRDRGLEWVYRLLTEPRRLWKRYLYNNPRFVLLFAGRLLRERLRRPAADRGPSPSAH